MKTAMVVSHLDQDVGSYEYYLCRELAKLGHEVTLYTSDRRRPGYPGVGKRLTDQGEMATGSKLKRIPAIFELYQIPFMPRLGKVLEQDRIDVIHSNEFFQLCSLYAARAAKKKKVPFILTQHGHKKPLNKAIGLPYWLVEKTVGRYVMNYAQKIIALTSDVEQYLVKNGVPQTKVEVVGTGVPTELYSPDIPSALPNYGIAQKDSVILFVGRLVENKGIAYLIESFKKLKETVDNAKLVIVGTGILQQNLKELARKLGLEEDIVFLGRVPQQSMPQIYSGASVFVLPTIYKEPFGIAAVEALSSGVPVIASNIDGLRVIVKDGEVGYLVQPKDVAGLASNIIKVLTTEGLRAQLSRNARQRALEEFSWAAKAKRISEIYQQEMIKI
jgi:glycosyltransferase involved in cell wall biosynthesis